MLITNRKKVSACLAALTFWVDTKNTVPQKKNRTSEDSVSATQIYKSSEWRKPTFARHQNVKQKGADKTWMHGAETMHFSEKCDKWKPGFVKMTMRFKSIWDGQLKWTTVEKHKIVLNPSDAPPIQSALYLAGPRRRKLKREEVAQMQKSDVADPAVAKWHLPVVFIPKKDESLRFCVGFRRLNAVTACDSYKKAHLDDYIDFFWRSEAVLYLGSQLRILEHWDEQNKADKAAIITHNGSYKYTKMSFDLENVPTTFRRAMGVVLSTVKS